MSTGSTGHDIFGRQPMEFGGAFAADSAVVTFGTGSDNIAGVGLLTQQLNMTYQQQITRLYEVGTRKTFYIAGRSQGNGSLSRVLGPRGVTLAFYENYGNVCNASYNTLLFQALTGCIDAGDFGLGTSDYGGDGFGDGNALVISLTGVVITTISMAVQAENMIVNEQLGTMYISMLAGDGT